MKRINERKLSVNVSKAEGGAINLTIAQIKETINVTLDELARDVSAGNASGVLELIERHKPA